MVQSALGFQGMVMSQLSFSDMEYGGVAPIKPDTLPPIERGCTAVVISSASPYVGATRCNHQTIDPVEPIQSVILP
jgi:hypothetical protein